MLTFANLRIAFVSSSNKVVFLPRHSMYEHDHVPHLEVVPHDEGQLPEAGEGLGGAGRDHTVVEDLVVQGVGPAGRLVLGTGSHINTLC